MSLLSGTQRRAKKRAARDGVITYSQRGWRGVFDGPDVLPSDADFLADARNCWWPTLDKSGGAWQRPIWTTKSASQLGASNTRLGQCIFEHVRADGTIDRLFFLGGKMYSWNGATTFTDITPSSTTISTTERIFCCSFNEKVIVTDGVNKPWAYDPAAATRAFIDVDGSGTSWVAQGAPVVYAAKLFFIIKSKSATTYNSRIIWSEEIDETLGYVQTGGATTYTNKWDLSQTSNDPLKALLATNVGLYYFRSASIGFIAGQVNSAFQTTATHDAISQNQGTLSPASVIEAHGFVWFVNQLGRPCRFAVGTNGVETIWTAADTTIALMTTGGVLGHLPRVGAAVYAADTNLVLFTIVGDGTSSTSTQYALVFDGDTGTYFGRWTLQSTCYIDSLANCTDSTGLKVVMAIGTNNATIDDTTRGFVWRLANTADANPWGNTGVPPYIITRFIGDEPRREKRYLLAVLESSSVAAITYTSSVASRADAPSGSVPATASVNATSTSPVQTVQSVNINSNEYGTMRTTWGWNHVARGFQAMFVGGNTTSASPVPHIFQAIEVDAVVLSRAVGGQ